MLSLLLLMAKTGTVDNYSLPLEDSEGHFGHTLSLHTVLVATLFVHQICKMHSFNIARRRTSIARFFVIVVVVDDDDDDDDDAFGNIGCYKLIVHVIDYNSFNPCNIAFCQC